VPPGSPDAATPPLDDGDSWMERGVAPLYRYPEPVVQSRGELTGRFEVGCAAVPPWCPCPHGPLILSAPPPPTVCCVLCAVRACVHCTAATLPHAPLPCSLVPVPACAQWVMIAHSVVPLLCCWQLGSTIVLVFEAPPEFVFTLGANSKVRLGQAIGVMAAEAEAAEAGDGGSDGDEVGISLDAGGATGSSSGGGGGPPGAGG
jgi:hypothetical protein